MITPHEHTTKMNKRQLIEHLRKEHSDTVLGGAKTLGYEPMKHLNLLHKEAHGLAKVPVSLPLFSSLMNEVFG